MTPTRSRRSGTHSKAELPAALLRAVSDEHELSIGSIGSIPNLLNDELRF
jgi:hypothetical protein